jgi:hypothetical protein
LTRPRAAAKLNPLVRSAFIRQLIGRQVLSEAEWRTPKPVNSTRNRNCRELRIRSGVARRWPRRCCTTPRVATGRTSNIREGPQADIQPNGRAPEPVRRPHGQDIELALCNGFEHRVKAWPLVPPFGPANPRVSVHLFRGIIRDSNLRCGSHNLVAGSLPSCCTKKAAGRTALVPRRSRLARQTARSANDPSARRSLKIYAVARHAFSKVCAFVFSQPSGDGFRSTRRRRSDSKVRHL